MITDQQIAFVERYFTCLDTDRAATLCGLTAAEGRAYMATHSVREAVSATMRVLLDDIAIHGRRIQEPALPQHSARFVVKVYRHEP